MNTLDDICEKNKMNSSGDSGLVSNEIDKNKDIIPLNSNV